MFPHGVAPEVVPIGQLNNLEKQSGTCAVNPSLTKLLHPCQLPSLRIIQQTRVWTRAFVITYFHVGAATELTQVLCRHS